jgi:ribosome recycling factor
MVQDGKPFGQDSLAIVVTLPKALEDKRDEIARIVDETIQEWRAKGDQAIDELIQDLRLRLEEELKRFVEDEGNKLLDKLEQALQSSCGGIGMVLAAPSLAVAWRRRQRRR